MKTLKSNLVPRVVGVMFLLSLMLTIACQRQKMKEPPSDFENVAFIAKTLESERGIPVGVYYPKTIYMLNVVVASVTHESVTVKYVTKKNEMKKISIDLEHVHDAFLPGEDAVLVLTFIDNFKNAEWRLDLNRKQ